MVVGLVTADVLKAIAGNEVRRQQPGGMAGLAAHLLTQRRHASTWSPSADAASCGGLMPPHQGCIALSIVTIAMLAFTFKPQEQSSGCGP